MHHFLKSILRRFRSYGKYTLGKKVIIGAAAIIALVAVYLILSLFTLSNAELQLAALKKSWQEEKICRDECQLRRRTIFEKLAVSLTRDPDSRLAQRTQEYFLKTYLERGLREDIVAIWGKAAAGNPPAFLVQYLSDPAADPRLSARIIAAFEPDALAAMNVNSGGVSLGGPLDFYFSILTSEADFPVKQEAIRAISANSDSASAFSSEQIDVLGSLILDTNTAQRLRQNLVMLLGDYYVSFPQESSLVLRSVYQNHSLDPISRAFSADILSRYESEAGEWVLPEISSRDWDLYYND